MNTAARPGQEERAIYPDNSCAWTMSPSREWVFGFVKSDQLSSEREDGGNMQHKTVSATNGSRRGRVLHALALWTLCASSVSAQDVIGVVVDDIEGKPIVGALVELMLEDDPVDAVLSSPNGGFALRSSGDGSYTIRVQRIGFQTWISESVDSNGAVGLRLVVPVEAVLLQPIDVTGKRQCRTTPSGALATWNLYERAIESLGPIIWAETAELYVYQVEVEQSIPDFIGGRQQYWNWRRNTASYRALRERATPDTFLLYAPLATLAPEDLSENGYVQVSDEGLRFFSPTAETLVSQEFIDTHCFKTVSNEKGWQGVAFTPLSGRLAPDVEGVLWLEGESAAPRQLEFRFTRLREMLREHELPRLMADIQARLERDPRVDDYLIQLNSIALEADFGGRLEFEVLANGSLITRRWELRTPLLDLRGWQLRWEREPASMRGTPVAFLQRRVGKVTAVLAPPQYADSAHR